MGTALWGSVSGMLKLRNGLSELAFNNSSNFSEVAAADSLALRAHAAGNSAQPAGIVHSKPNRE
jgi:hypothetical protein